MTADSSFSVEDFLEALTSQLDRTQDALRMKAVNRPLTYAIRDFAMDLRVHVELGADGRVMFRPSTGEDSGASLVHIGFTTVNRTMIEENTVALSTVRSPTLDELGLDEQERRGLERLGVRNAAQLDQLSRTTGDTAVARYSGLPVNRLRQAMAQGRPEVRSVRPAEPVAPQREPIAPPTLPPARGPRPVDLPGKPIDGAPVRHPGTTPVTDSPTDRSPADHSSADRPSTLEPRIDRAIKPVSSPPSDVPTRIRLPGNTRRVIIGGPRLEEAAQQARMEGRDLGMRPVDGGVEVDLGEGARDGRLELDLGDDGIVAIALEFDAPGGSQTARAKPDQAAPNQAAPDPTTPDHTAPNQAAPDPTAPNQAALDHFGREQAGSEQAGSEQAGSEQAGSEQAGCEHAGSERAGSERAGSERAGSERAGSERAGSEHAGPEQAGPAQAAPAQSPPSDPWRPR